MPIPGDNGNPKAERDAQNERIKHVAEKDAICHKELNLDKPAPKENCIFGRI